MLFTVFLNLTNILCDFRIDCHGHGLCNMSSCICDEGYDQPDCGPAFGELSDVKIIDSGHIRKRDGLDLYIQSANSTCSSHKTCNNNGYCMKNNTCHCNKEYATRYPDEECKYKRASQMTAFILQLFFGCVGIGRWIIGSYTFAVFQVVIFALSICEVCHRMVPYTKTWLFQLIIAPWWLADLILIGMNNISDEHGIYPYSWSHC